MAEATLALDQYLFPNGTTVYATPQNFNDEPVAAVVASNQVTYDGLHEDTPYLARARVAGSLNEVRFRSSLDTAGGGSVSDADSATKGVVQLAGDLAGTAASPIVPGTARAIAASKYGVSTGASAAANATNLQAAADAARVAKADLVLDWTGTVNISSPVTLSRRGQTIRGTNAWYTIVKQTATNQHAFVINDDGDAGGTIAAGNQHVIFEDFRILGPGFATSTMDGIHGGDDGDWLVMRNMTVQGFARGVFLDGWAQVLFDTTVLHYNGINCHTSKVDSAANTISWINSGTARADTIGWLHEGGGGCTINGGDWVEQPLGIQLGTGTGLQATLVLNGGNFEAIQDAVSALPRFIQVNSGSRLVVNGTQFQKVDGVDGDAIAVTGGHVHVNAATLTGMATGKVLVRKGAGTDVVRVENPTANLSTTTDAVADPSTSWAYSQFISRLTNGVPSAASGYRGLVLQGMGRDSATERDDLFAYLRDAKQGVGTYRYSRYTLSRIITGAGSPEGVVSAPLGTLYVNDSGGASTTLYVKESGGGNTGWLAYGPPTAGPTGAAGPAGSSRDIMLSAAGVLTENFDLGMCSASTAPVSGTVFGSLLGFFSGQTVTNIAVGVAIAGAGTAPTTFKVGLANAAGNIVAVSANEASNSKLTTVGVAEIPLSTPYTIPSDGGYRPVLIEVGTWGTTQMTLARAGTLVAGGLTTPLTAKQRRYATYGASQTDLPAVSAALSTAGTTTVVYWMGAS